MLCGNRISFFSSLDSFINLGNSRMKLITLEAERLVNREPARPSVASQNYPILRGWYGGMKIRSIGGMDSRVLGAL